MQHRLSFLFLAGLLAVPVVGSLGWAQDGDDAGGAPSEVNSTVDETGSDDHSEHIGAKGVDMSPAALSKDLAFWTLIVFAGLLVLLKKFAWGPITEALDQREASIRQNIADAEASRLKAERMLAEHEEKLAAVQEEVREIIAEAKRDAESTRQSILDDARKDAEATRERAVQDIEQARDVALKELFDAAAERVADATEQVLGRSLNSGDQQRLIDDALSQFSSSDH